MALRCLLAALAPAFFASPARAYGPSSYVSDVMTDTTFPTFEEGLIQWKAIQTGVSTAAEAGAMPAALEVGFGSLVSGAEAGAVGLAAVGTPVGWLALLGVAGGAGAYCIWNGCGSADLWQNEGSQPIEFGETVPPGANITAGQPLWHVTGGTNQSKTQTCYGSTPDEAIGECVSWMNTADTTTSYTAAPANTGNTAVLTEFSKTTGKATGANVSVTAATSGNASYSCPAPGALTVTSSGCTYSTGDTTPGFPVLALQVGDPITETQEIPLQYGKLSLSPDVLADVANDAWRQAASQQGYKGLPYSTGNPITTADVQSYESTLPSSAIPTVQSATAPIPLINPTAGQPDIAASQPSSAPTSNPTVDLPNVTTPQGTSTASSGGSTSTTTTTGTSGSTTTTTTSTGSSNTTNVTVNTCGAPGQAPCEVDWNPTGATPPATPAAPQYSDIFNLLLTFSNLSFWKSWTVTVPAGACQVFTIPYTGGGQTQSFTLDICTPLASMQGLFQSIETALIAMTTVFILLGA